MYNHDKTFVAEKTVFELLESESWEEESLGLFDTIDLAEKFKESRIKGLRENYDDSAGDFNDWYKWSIRPRIKWTEVDRADRTSS